MIELRRPAALAAGDRVLVWWPDWFMRRAVVIGEDRFTVTNSDAPEEVWRIVVRFEDGEDHLLEHVIFRGPVELVPVVVPRLAGRHRNRAGVFAAPRGGEDAETPSVEDEADALEYLGDAGAPDRVAEWFTGEPDPDA